MNRAFLSAIFATIVTIAPAAHAQTGHDGHSGHGGHEAATASDAYMQAMSRMNDDMDGMEMTGKAGVDFAVMMIPHHQSAIDMAKAYLESSENDPELTKLSEEIIAAQEGEIAFLRDWLSRNGN